MVSERKRQANRRNAKGSTGPKDTRRTRLNAQKHGLLSKAAIIRDGDAKEDPLELQSLFDELWEDLDPVGKMQEMLVDRIVSCYWRLRRAQRAEVGEIRRVADNAIMNAMLATAAHYDRTLEDEETVIGAGSGQGSRRDLRKTTLGLAHIRRVLDMMRGRVEEEGTLTLEQLSDVTRIYGRREGSFALALTVIALAGTDALKAKDDEEPDTGLGGLSPDERKEALVALIDKEVKRVREEAALVADREKFSCEASALARHLPSGKVLEKNLRYETTIERQMYRALKELLELQAVRRAHSTHLGTADNGV